MYTLLYISLSENLGCLTWVKIHQPQQQRYPVPQVHAGSFRFSIIHWIVTWTTGLLTCIRDHSYAYMYTHVGWAHRQWVSTTFLTLTYLEFEPWIFGSGVRRSTNLVTVTYYTFKWSFINDIDTSVHQMGSVWLISNSCLMNTEWYWYVIANSLHYRY